MLAIDQLSRIGFGAYRTSVDSAEHQKALHLALQSGCNLIDTSSNYLDGKSEALVGKLLREHPDLKGFVITKAGYIQGSNLKVWKALQAKVSTPINTIKIDDNFRYSIDPNYLQEQMKVSRQRLQTERIDGFLLHNPEYYFKQEGREVSTSEFYSQIQTAFEFLEEKVVQGEIRYYGISSNTFPLSTASMNTIDLNRVIAIAEEVSAQHHFKLIQFPFNFFEKGALQAHHAGRSLLQIAQQKGLVTLCNRPLNANTQYGPFRIATYQQAIEQLSEKEEAEVFASALDHIQQRMLETGKEGDPLQFPVMQFLRDSRREMNDPAFVQVIFESRVYPFLIDLYQKRIPPIVLHLFGELQRYAVLFAKKTITEQAQNLRQQLIEKGMLSTDDQRSIAAIACAQYLDTGIDHVLVGMRNCTYVNDLKELF